MTAAKWPFLPLLLLLATIPDLGCNGIGSLDESSSNVRNSRSFSHPTIHRRLVIGDFNGDGNGDWAIGLPEATKCQSGEIQIWYERFEKGQPHQVWQPDTSGIHLANTCDGNFGTALAVGDFNSDGYDDIAVGAPGDVVSGRTNAGSVQVLYGTRNGFSPVDAQLFSQDSADVDDTVEGNDAFGTALASGDFDCDGYADLAVGVPGEEIDHIINAGSVHTFVGSAEGLSSSRSQFIQPTDLMQDSYLGSFLAAGNIDQDAWGANACDDLAIGIPGASLPDASHAIQPAAGAAAVLYGDSTGLGDRELWHQESHGVDGKNQADDEFGRGVWLMDENADGYSDLLAYSARDSTMFLFRGSSEGLVSSPGADAGLVGQGAGRDLCVFLCNLAWLLLPPGPVCDCSFCDEIQAPPPNPCPNCG